MPGIVSRCDLQILEQKTCAKKGSGRRKRQGRTVTGGEREREAEADILSQDVCVCVLCIVFLWQIAHVRDAILLPTYSPGSPLSPTRLLAVCPIARSSSLPDVQLNLKFLRNPTKHGAKI